MANLTSSAALAPSRVNPLTGALRAHWPEYLIEGACLGLFMVAACVFASLLEHPASWFHELIPSPALRRVVMGLAMGTTAISLIRSPWGQRSGAHLNPAVTLAFASLGRVAGADILFYIASQFAGGAAGVGVASLLVGPALAHSAVNYAATMPGRWGVAPAFAAEAGISFFLMLTVLFTSNSLRLRDTTPFFAGALVSLYITFEAPVSGMSMNPARTLASAVFADDWRGLWIYFAAPLAGMILAAQLFRLRFGAHRIFCVKLHHHNSQRCIFRCNYGDIYDGR